MIDPEKLDKSFNYLLLPKCWSSYLNNNDMRCDNNTKSFCFNKNILANLCEKHFKEVQIKYEIKELDIQDLFYLRITKKL